MNIHLNRAAQLLKQAALPDRTVSNVFSAALDGRGQSKTAALLRGVKEDAFEVVKNPVLAAGELFKAIR